MNKISIPEVNLLVGKINERFSQLYKLSNDELRDYVQKIKLKILSEDGNDAVLGHYLVEIYAAVKETARRFTEGEIIVSANDKDRELADSFGFIAIRGDKAVYKNQWKVKGEDYKWDMVHYDEQLSGGIYLHYGHALEMATGEGKTLVATLPVFLNALTGKGVHLMTVNEYLSERDYEITRPIYMFHGLSADCIERYERNSDGRKKAYQSDITFGKTSEFVFDYLFDNLATDPKEWVQTTYNFAIIDELDSILIDNANIPHIVGGGNYFSNENLFKENAPIIEELIQNPELYEIDEIKKSSDFTISGKEWLKDKTQNPMLFQFSKKYEITGFDDLDEAEKEKWAKVLNQQATFYQLLKAYKNYERDVDYIIDDGKIVIIDQNTGRKRKGSRWEHGLHTAIEVKEKVKVQKDFLGLGVISLKNYLNLYSKKAGMSGTIITAKEELESIYQLPCAQQKPHRPNIRIDEPLKIYYTKEEKTKAVINRIIELQAKGRPSMVGCLNIKKSEELCSKLSEMDISFNRLDAKNLDEEAKTVAKAGEVGIITISTSIAGRGTDIKPSEEVIQNGGLTIIIPDLFPSVRIDLQLKGRTGRQGNPGKSETFVSLEDDILKFLTTKEKEKMNSILASIDDKDILSSQEIGHYFYKAQENEENFYREQRKETARKDDIVAPRRLKFYETRKQALFRSKDIDSLILQLSEENDSELLEKISTHLSHLYEKVKILFLKSLRYSPSRNELLVPFSFNSRPFTLKFDIRKGIGQPSYFIEEFKRAITLNTMDNYWKDFVVYMMSPLDKKEINELDIKYDKIMSEINSNVINILTQALIPINIRQEEQKIDPPMLKQNSVKEIVKVDSNKLCPCGSRKKYCECHGKNIRNTKRRR